MAVINDLGSYRQVVTVTTKGAVVPDGDGGYTQADVAVTPTPWRAAIERATSLRLAEKAVAGSVLARATYVLTGRYHSGLTMDARLTWRDRAGLVHTADVIDIDDVDGAGVQSVVLVTEIPTL